MKIKNAHREAYKKATALIQVRDNNDQDSGGSCRDGQERENSGCLKSRLSTTDFENELMVARGKGYLRTLGMSCTHCYI